MRSLRALLAGAALVAASLAVLAAPAAAEPGPVRLVSKSATEQAALAVTPALSADGRYLVFRGTIGGLSGIFREELASGAIEPVVAGTAVPAGPGADASSPSISADGRYVSFTTRAQLDPADDPEASSHDVYVADMASAPPTYQLASAADGSPASLGGDSAASPRVALSADGREVVFVNGGQVYLRRLDTAQTILVSAARDPLSGEMEPDVPVPGGAVVELNGMPEATGAALSADGTTVAWLGTHLPAQVPLLGDERAKIQAEDASPIPYDEPLWRRVADGPTTPTRRVVGGGDPLAPGCPTDGTLADPACQGPFPEITAKGESGNLAMGWIGTQGPIDPVPQLSADGRFVALLGNPTEATNVFLVDMAPGLTRDQALRQLTRQVAVRPSDEGAVVNREPYVPLNGHIWDLAISADGQRLLFATARQRFPLAPPNLVTSPPAQLGLVEAYLLDLETESLHRISHGAGGPDEASLGPGAGANGDGASAPSLDARGDLLAFASTAANLVEGDGNDASDVFLVEDHQGSSREAPVSISAGLPAPQAKGRRRLGLSAFSLPDGEVKLVAMVPGAGRLRAQVAAPLAVGARPRQLAAGQRRAAAGGPLTMTLKLSPRLRHLARSREGLYATAHAAFRLRGGARLKERVQVRFHAHRSKRGTAR
jgi:Tol biopolymer transport system component